MIVVGRVHAHAGAGDSVFAEGDASDDCLFCEGAISVVAIELVGLRIVRKEEPIPGAASAGIGSFCAEGGVLGVLPGIVGSIQAMETIKLVLGPAIAWPAACFFSTP